MKITKNSLLQILEILYILYNSIRKNSITTSITNPICISDARCLNFLQKTSQTLFSSQQKLHWKNIMCEDSLEYLLSIRMWKRWKSSFFVICTSVADVEWNFQICSFLNVLFKLFLWDELKSNFYRFLQNRNFFYVQHETSVNRCLQFRSFILIPDLRIHFHW